MNENIHWSEEMQVQKDAKVTVCYSMHGTLLEPYCLDAAVNAETYCNVE
jgi:hypothetical protein